MSIVGSVKSYFESRGYQTKFDLRDLYLDPPQPTNVVKVPAVFFTYKDGQNIPHEIPPVERPKPTNELEPAEQFDRLYDRLLETRQLQPDVTPILHTFLFMDLEAVVQDLPFQNRQKIPSNFVKGILDDAIVLSLDDLKKEMRERYVNMVSNGYSRVDAFEEAIKPFGELIQAAQSKNITQNPIYLKIENHLKDLDSQITAQIQ